MKRSLGSLNFLFLSLGIAILVCNSLASADHFKLPDFPYYRQETEWFCGVASLQMVYKYITGQSVPQNLFASVARTSQAVGTNSKDIVRALRYSRLSWPANQNMALSWTGSGYQGYDVGFSVNGYDSKEPWLKVMMNTLMDGLPIIVLQSYWFDDPGGHYRVVYGFNSTHIFTKDPWDRDGQPRNLDLLYADFITLWHYVESAEKGPRYFGAAAAPWPLLVDFYNSTTKELQLVYEYSNPIHGATSIDAPTAMSIMAEIDFDPKVWLCPKTSFNLKTNLAFNNKLSFTIPISCISTYDSCLKNSPRMRVSGIISDSVTQVPGDGGTDFPGYDYTDVIGSEWRKIPFLTSKELENFLVFHS